MTEAHVVCARFHRAIELIGARWSGAILRAVFTDQHRYAEIKAAIPGISDTMLAQRLRELEAAGIISREVRGGSPVSVEYRLTERGAELAPVLEALRSWSHRWIVLDPSAADSNQHHQPARDRQTATPRKSR